MIRDKINDEFKKQIKRDFILWNMIIQPFVFMLIMYANYNDPEFGFQGAQYGLGVIITILFPIIWVLIYLFSKYIALQRRELEKAEGINGELENKENKGDES